MYYRFAAVQQKTVLILKSRENKIQRMKRLDSNVMQVSETTKNETERLFAEVRGSDTVAVVYHFATFSGPRELLNETKLQLLEDCINYLKQREDVTY